MISSESRLSTAPLVTKPLEIPPELRGGEYAPELAQRVDGRAEGSDEYHRAGGHGFTSGAIRFISAATTRVRTSFIVDRVTAAMILSCRRTS